MGNHFCMAEPQLERCWFSSTLLLPGRSVVFRRRRLLAALGTWCGGAAGVAGNVTGDIAGILKSLFVFGRAQLQRFDGQVKKVAAYKIKADSIIRRTGTGLGDHRFSIVGKLILGEINGFQDNAQPDCGNIHLLYHS